MRKTLCFLFMVREYPFVGAGLFAVGRLTCTFIGSTYLFNWVRDSYKDDGSGEAIWQSGFI